MYNNDNKKSERLDKESKSIYLPIVDWEYLNKESKGQYAKIIKEMINERRSKIEKCN